MKMSKFQIGLLIFFGAFIVLAIILFSRNRGGQVTGGTLSVWGTMSTFDFNNMLAISGLSGGDTFTFEYSEKQLQKISADFTNALAEGRGPDLIVIPVENLLSEKNKLLYIPNESVRPSDFVSTFIKQGELFQDTLGTYALPMYVDPMVMYWNRDIFSTAGFAVPPMYWDQIYDYVEKLTKKDNAGNIIQSAMALGEARNIPHAKEILSLLMLQAGTPVVSMVGTELRSVLVESFGRPVIPAVSALEFYTQFANPAKSFYSWNRSLIEAGTSFTSGKSAMYLGFASERPVLRAKNPTLDIGVVSVPQSRTSARAITFGRLYGVAISRSARDPSFALLGALALVDKGTVSVLANSTSYIPARRDLLANTPIDPAGFIFYTAALQSVGWLDPDSAKTRTIWNEMVESVTSGRSRVDAAVSTANNSLNTLLEQI